MVITTNISEVFNIKEKQVMLNEQIREKEVRLIDVDGSMLGVMSARDAQLKANERALDLVMISPNANPPVCRIMDHGKYLFELQKKEKEAKKKQKVISVKEVRLSAKIEQHDFDFKVKNAIKFLQAGDKVKVSVKFRGREIAYKDSGYEVLQKFAEAVSEYGSVDKKPIIEGRNMSMYLSPTK